VVTGAFGADPLISLPAEKPPGGLVVRTLSEGPGPLVRSGDYVLFDVAAKVWAGDRLVLDTYANHQPQGLPLPAGHGPRLVPGETVVTQFTGALWRTGAVFDSSWQHGDPQSFVLGSGQVIAGWNQGLAGQRVDSRVLLVIPPRLGYGKAGNPPAITGKDTLVFVVDILAATHG